MALFELTALVNAIVIVAAAAALICLRRQRNVVVIGIGVLALAVIGLNAYPFIHRTPAVTSETSPLANTLEESTRHNVADGEVYRRFFYRFHDHVYLGQENRTTWLGIETLQNPNDAWIHQEIIHDVKPDFIIETGTHKGGSAILWAMILQQVNPNGKIITVDIEDNCENVRELPIWKEKIEFHKGSSTDPGIVAAVTKRVAGGKVMVILDSDHAKGHVLREIKSYAPLVSIGSYLCVQDTYYDYPPAVIAKGNGPWTAVQEFLATNDQFAIDSSRERLLLTFNPRGHLKRVK